MRLRVLDRYLLGTFLRIFGLTALSAPLLFVLADVTERLEVDIAERITAGGMLVFYLGQFPTYLTWAFPVAAMVATLFTLQPLVRHGEIAAMLASGIRLHRLFVPFLLGGAVASVAGIVLLEATAAFGRGRSTGAGVPAQARASRGAFAYLTDSGEFLSVQRLEAGAQGQLFGVVLRSEIKGPPVSVQYVTAKEAQWIDGRGWMLRDGHVWSISSEGSTMYSAFAQFIRRTLTERPHDLLAASPVDLPGMSFRELGRLADRMERSGASAAYPRTKQWERIAIPLTTLAIILFAAPLATLAGRGNGQLGTALSLVLTILYLALLRTTESLGSAGLLPPALAASFPALLFGSGGALLLRRAKS